ncbi:hypothetical protein M3P05_08615 [Sansalvadorimonas sp. 2012CJ34-2]|uniref:Uncharacterized protein n=1 Tax=Parendozoicomonas callyspongiae TaxID=2942213 RepID=A0ABT0PHM8_9GAMM|nr:hypothetical protein [Sansalvadorimonas sp. 2012CJ34-2]MCL6269998.1 hypothetical protein [Sansalvadorimonas sp. 2012CJ34-2]
MAGIDRGVSGQQPIRPADAKQLQRTEQTGQSDSPQTTKTDNLSVSHTQGQQKTGNKTHLGNIPSPDPSASNYLSSQNPTDLKTLLANVNAEVTQTQEEFAISNAKAKETEVKEAQEARQKATAKAAEDKKELEKLTEEKEAAQKDSKCIDVKVTLVTVLTLGGIKHNSWYDKQMEAKANAELKIATIELQEQGLIDIPAPTLPPIINDISKNYSELQTWLKTVPEAQQYRESHASGPDRKQILETKALAQRISDMGEEGQKLLEAVKNSDSRADFYKEALLIYAESGSPSSSSQNNILGNLQVTETETVTGTVETGNISGTDTPPAETNSISDDLAWQREMAALMNAQEEEMNEIISQLEQAEQAIVGAAQDGQDIASLRFTSI